MLKAYQGFTRFRRLIGADKIQTKLARELLSSCYREGSAREKLFEAVGRLEVALEINPAHSEAEFLRGLARIQLSETELEPRHFYKFPLENAIESFNITKSMYKSAFLLKAFCLWACGRAEEALAELDQMASKSTPFDQGDAFDGEFLASVKFNCLRELHTPIIAFDNRNDRFEGTFFRKRILSTALRIKCLQRLGQFDAAHEVIEESLKISNLDKTSRLLLLNLKADNYFSQDSFEEAIDMLNKVIIMQGDAFDPSDKMPYAAVINKAACLRHLDRYREVHDLIRMYGCEDKDLLQRLYSNGLDVYEQKILVYAAEDLYEKAMEWNEMKKSSIEKKEEINKKKYKEKKESFERFIDRNIKEVKDRREIKEDWLPSQEISTRWSVNDNCMYRKTKYLAFLDRDDEALQEIEQALDDDPSNELKIHLLNIKGSILTKQESLTDARKIFIDALKLIEAEEINLKNHTIHYSKAQCLRWMERYKGAHEANDKALALNNKFAQGYNVRGLIFLGEGRFDEAIDAFAKACECNPNVPSFYYNAALSLILKGNDSQARTSINRALKLKKPHPYASILRGFLSLLKNEPDASERSFLRANRIISSGSLPSNLALKELSFLLMLGRGLLAYRQGDADALKNLKHPKIYEKGVWYYHLKGLCLSHIDSVEAKKVYEEGLRHTSRKIFLKQRLGEIQSILDKGEKVSVVSDKDRENALLTETCGRAIKKVEDLTEAKEALKRMLDETSIEKASLEGERDTLNEKISLLENRVRTLERENAKLEDTKEENKKLSQENERLHKEKDGLMSEIQGLKESLGHLKKVIEEKEHAIRSICLELEKHKKETDKRISKLEKEQTKASEKLSGFWSFGAKKSKAKKDTASEAVRSEMKSQM